MHLSPRPAILVCLVGVLVGCAHKNPGNPDHRHKAEEQEAIDNICGAEPTAWKAAFANEAAVLEQIRSADSTLNGRAIMKSLAADTRSCDDQMYRVCRICMELENTGNCSQIQAGSMEHCLEKGAGVTDESEDAPVEAAEAPAEAPAE